MTAKEIRLKVPEAHYTLFDVTRDGMPEIIVVNDALLSFSHPEVFPWHLRIVLEARELIDNGMPSEPESQLLFEIGDEIEQAILDGRTAHGSKNAMFLARSTWNESRELLYQVHDPEIAHAALQGLIDSKKWPRLWDYRMHEDPEWQEAARVFALFPAAEGHNA